MSTFNPFARTDRRQKVAAGVVVSTVAALAVVGGTLAQFTDSDTTAPQVLTAGTVAVDLVEGSNWTDNLNNLAVGDTADRAAVVDNTSTLDIKAMRLTADVTDTVGEFGGALSEAVMVDITQDGTTVLANDVRLADLAAGYDLTFASGNLPANTDVPLLFHYEVAGARLTETGDRTSGQRDTADNPDNKYQGASLAVTYTIDAVQRDGQDVDPVAPTNVTAVADGDSAVVTFDEPATNPDGTIYTATAVDETVTAPASFAAASTTGPATTTSFAAATAPASFAAAAVVTPSASGPHSPLTVTGLALGTTYRFTVTATAPNGTTSTPSTPSNSVTTPAPVAAGSVTGWGNNQYGQNTVPSSLTDATQVASGANFSVALRTNGTVVAWGDNRTGQTNVPAGLANVTKIAAGGNNGIAVKSDGSITAWGSNASGQMNFPVGLTGVVQAAVGDVNIAVVKADGTVLVRGSNNYGQTNVPPGLTNVKQVAIGAYHVAALKNDGTVVTWGYNNGQMGVPAGLTGVTMIAAGYHDTAAVKSDGTVIVWGPNAYGENAVPAGLTGVKRIAVGGGHVVALKTDGTVVAWGRKDNGQTTVPTGLGDVQWISAGTFNTLAIRRLATTV